MRIFLTCLPNYTIYCTKDCKESNRKTFGAYKTNEHKVLNIGSNFKIVLDIGQQVHTISCSNNETIKIVADCYYSAAHIGQYNNITYGVMWSTSNHSIFDKYVRRIVRFVMMCYKYSMTKQFIPKGVLFMIIKYIAI